MDNEINLPQLPSFGGNGSGKSLPGKAPNEIVGQIVAKLLSVGNVISDDITKSLNEGPLGDKGPQEFVNDAVETIPDALLTVNFMLTKTMDVPLRQAGIER